MSMQGIFRKQVGATRTEIITVFITLTAIVVFSYYMAHQAAANTPSDPVFRHLVRPESTKPMFKTDYLYVPLLFQLVASLSVAVLLLPARIQESWFLMTTHTCQRRYLYLRVVFCLLISAGIHSHSSNAIMRASAPSIDQSISTEGPNRSTH
jgi:hypothetical protein